jgi:hypothetical protein
MIRLIKRLANRGQERARQARAEAIAELNAARLKGDTRRLNAAQRQADKATEHALRMGV